MTKTIQIILFVIVALLAGLLVGAKYSESIKSHFSWMSDKDEVALPDLSNEEIEGAQDALSNDKQAEEKPVTDSVNNSASDVVAPDNSSDKK